MSSCTRQHSLAISGIEVYYALFLETYLVAMWNKIPISYKVNHDTFCRTVQCYFFGVMYFFWCTYYACSVFLLCNLFLLVGMVFFLGNRGLALCYHAPFILLDNINTLKIIELCFDKIS